MHVPFVAASAALSLHQAGVIDLDTNGDGTLDQEELLATALGTHRSTSIFGGDTLGTPHPAIRVLYGERYLPRYDAAARSYTIPGLVPRERRQVAPVFGSSGFGNFFNAYDWNMVVFDDQLYVGTFDWSQVARVALEEGLGVDSPEPTPQSAFLAAFDTRFPQEGADLFRFPGPHRPAVAESFSGVGNDSNYGIRTSVVDDETLYLGSANPMNLR